MKCILALVSLTFALVSAPLVQADIAIEPYVGYMLGKTGTGSNTENMDGTEYGLRLGYYSLGFMIGAEYMGGSMTQKSSSNSLTFTKSDIGVTAGFKFPILLRIYGTYYVQASDKTSTSEYTGSGFKLGVGYTFLPLVSLNLEFYDSSYNKNKTSGTAADFRDTLYGLSVSVPLTF